jgi:hypothetical protein
MKFKMNTLGNPEYCRCEHLCYHGGEPIEPTYKGKYYRPECGKQCWCNSIAPKRKDPDLTKIRVHRNSSIQSCPICEERFKQSEYVVNLGFSRRHVLVHPKCIGAFIDKLVKFKEEELPSIIDKLSVEVL